MLKLFKWCPGLDLNQHVMLVSDRFNWLIWGMNNEVPLFNPYFYRSFF